MWRTPSEPEVNVEAIECPYCENWTAVIYVDGAQCCMYCAKAIVYQGQIGQHEGRYKQTFF